MNPERPSRPKMPQSAMQEVPCPGCGGDRFETIFQDCRDLWLGVPGSFPVVRCLDCALVQTNPRPSATELEAFYPDEYSPEGFSAPERPHGRSFPVRLSRWIAAIPYRVMWGSSGFVSGIEPGRVLDVGAGQGLRLARLQELGWEPWLLEPRAEIVQATARELEIPEDRVTVGYAEDVSLPEDHFDLVVMDHTVEHLSDPGAVFDSIARWLKPGGRLLITCPNYGSLESRFFGRWWFGLDMPRHLQHFSPETLERMAAKSGLSLEDLRPQFGVLVSPSVVLRQSDPRPADRQLDSKLLPLPGRVATFALELLAMVAQAFGYMPMMEVVLRRPGADRRNGT